MTRRSARALLLCAALAGGGCGSLPVLVRPPAMTASDEAGWIDACRVAFPAPPWQATHTITARLPLGKNGAFLGVVTAPPPAEQPSFRSVLLSVEGLVLLDQTWTAGRVTTHRALPPLDRPGFAEGMAEDIRLLFIQPDGAPEAVGSYPGTGERVCRWRLPDGRREDVAVDPDGGWRILVYDDDGDLVRHARFGGPLPSGFTARAVLEAPGRAGYSFVLVLVGVTPVAGAAAAADPAPAP